MSSGIRFLVAARRAEIHALEELARTSELVSSIGLLVHALQKERGLSNVFLASAGRRGAAQRLRQIPESVALEAAVRARLELLDTRAPEALPNGARLLSRIAVALHLLESLAPLREAVAREALTTEQSTAAYVRAVGALLAVVLQAIDSASDPTVSRELVATFEFMQGKEFAGQERALGAAVFAAWRVDAAGRARWAHLIEQQDRCFERFAAFADASALAAWRTSQPPAMNAALDRLRRLGASVGDGRATDADHGDAWFALCTDRIDAMQAVERVLAEQLRILCDARIADARRELEDQQAILEALQREALADDGDPTQAIGIGPRLQRSVLDLLHEQARRLQALGDELESVRAALHERKVVERAKGLLMASRRLSEDDAYRLLRETAMNQHRKLTEVAASVLAMAEFL